MLATAERHALSRIATPGRDAPQATLPQEVDLLHAAINQVDYGLVALDASSARVHFANASARGLLAAEDSNPDAPAPDTGLRLTHGQLLTARPADAPQLRTVLQRAGKGLRGLLCLGKGPAAVPVAVVPLAAVSLGGFAPSGRLNEPAPGVITGAEAAPCALLVFAKQQLCDDSTITLFARERGLTSAEGQVLAQVCKGLRPTEIASRHGVRISTVRTQLRSIRAKTSAHTIRDLVHLVSVLPPMARQVPLRLAN